MSDNLILTLLGAVGIGALVMSMNSQNVQEDWDMGKQKRDVQTIMLDKDTGKEIDITGKDDKKSVLLGLGKEGNRQNSRDERAKMQRQQQDVKENFQNLGSSAIANPAIFHSNPQFNQTIPQPSPDMQNLGVPSRMHVSSMQGYTDSFNQPFHNGNIIGSVENFEDPTPAAGQDNVIVFERLMASTRGGGRFNAKGSVDFIRGDIPICPDPCQSGWFKSSAKPQDVLKIGAVSSQIAGDSMASDLINLLKENGRQVSNTQFTPSDMGTQVSRAAGTVGTQQLP